MLTHNINLPLPTFSSVVFQFLAQVRDWWSVFFFYFCLIILLNTVFLPLHNGFLCLSLILVYVKTFLSFYFFHHFHHLIILQTANFAEVVRRQFFVCFQVLFFKNLFSFLVTKKFAVEKFITSLILDQSFLSLITLSTLSITFNLMSVMFTFVTQALMTNYWDLAI